MPPAPRDPLARLLENVKVSDAGCHEWQGALTSNGYGIMNIRGRTFRTHRLAWELQCGPLEPDDCVLHRCDNRLCANIEHLFLGDRLANNRDAIAKGRRVDKPRILTPEQIGKAKGMEAGGMPVRQIASVLDVSDWTVWMALNDRDNSKRKRTAADPRNRKVTDEQIQQGRALRAKGLSYRAIAGLLGLKEDTLYYALTGRVGYAATVPDTPET
jgi:hypothetical protein